MIVVSTVRRLAAGRGLPANADVIGLYFVLALGLLAPIASNAILPSAPDHANHTAFVVEARHALEEGQFPLRVAPFALDGLRYPLFQFYGQTPYLLSGIVYKYVTPENPWMALKIVYLAGLTIAGFFVFKLGQFLQFDRTISALMGVVYITAPYLLINIHARGAYTEAFAQLMLPLLAYSTTCVVRRDRPLDVLWAALSWLVLGTSHVITFVYGTIFYLLFVAALYLFRRLTLRAAAILVALCLVGWSVSAFQWYPAVASGPLRLQDKLGDVFKSRWLTPGSALLSLTSTPPEPLGGLNIAHLHPAIGLPILIACLGILYMRRAVGQESSAVWPCLVLFIVAWFGVWSPVDFWAVLPDKLHVLQFTYRLLTFTTVFGTMLFAYFLATYQRRYGVVSFLPCILALVLACQSYLPVLSRNNRSLGSIVTAPESSYASDAYLFAGAVPGSLESYRNRYEMSLPLTYSDDWLEVDKTMELARPYVDGIEGDLLIRGLAQDVGRCRTLAVTLDGAPAATREIEPGAFEWRVPMTSLRPFFHGATGKLGFNSVCGFVPNEVDRNSADFRTLWIQVQALRFENSAASVSTAKDVQILRLKEVRQTCRIENAAVVCEFDLPRPAEAQLPIFFYPSLLHVSVNGQSISYQPSYDGQNLMATVPLDAGRNHVVAKFSGSPVGNAISGGAGLALLALLGWRYRRPRRDSVDVSTTF